MLKINLKTKKRLIHPFLFSAFPILILFSQNTDLLSTKDIIFPLFLFTAITFVALLVFYFIFKNKSKSALLTSFFWIIFVSYGYIFSILVTNVFQVGNKMTQHIVLLVIFFIVIIIGVIKITKTKRKLNNATSIMNAVAITIIIIPLITIFTYNFQNDEFVEQIEISDTVSSNQFLNSPNIYYIILDEYASESVLEDTFNFDNSDLINFLKENNFQIISNSFSNYSTSFLALSAALNMEYVNWLSDKVGEFSTDRHIAYQLIDKNKVMSILKSKGYITATTDSGWQVTRYISNADLNLCGENKFLNSEFLIMILRNSILNPIYLQLFDPDYRERILCTFDEIPNVQFKTNKPVFVFSHILLPHGPYYWGPNGEHLTPSKATLELGYDRSKDGYKDQLQFTNKKIMDLINKILTESERESIIVIQSDTGTSINYYPDNITDQMIYERMSNINFIYFPYNQHVLYDDMTPVNTFPLIFNTFFEDDYEMLEDRSYYSLESEPYRLKEVTEFLNNEEALDISFWKSN